LNIYVWKYTNEKGFQTVALIDYAISVIWIRRFQECGEFELYLPATEELFSLFLYGLTFLTKEDELKTAMKVESIQLTTDPEEGDRLIISGRSAECILSQRLVLTEPTYDNFAPDNVVISLVYGNAIWNGTPERVIPFLATGHLIGMEEMVQQSFYLENLLETIVNVCQSYHMGFSLEFSGTMFTMQPYLGTDRTGKVIFSGELDNLGKTEYLYDTTNYFNGAVETAQKEDRIFAGTVRTASGIDLYERHIQSENLDTDALTDDALIAELEKRATNNIYQSKVKQEFSGEIVNTEMYQFGKDYYLGDKVSIINGYGIEGTAVVTEITETEDASGYKLIPTFSDWKVI